MHSAESNKFFNPGKALVFWTLVSALPLAISGCVESTKEEVEPTPTPIPTLSLGYLLSVRPIVNQKGLSQVETTKGYYTVYGYPSGMKGEKVLLVPYLREADGLLLKSVTFPSTGTSYDLKKDSW